MHSRTPPPPPLSPVSRPPTCLSPFGYVLYIRRSVLRDLTFVVYTCLIRITVMTNWWWRAVFAGSFRFRFHVVPLIHLEIAHYLDFLLDDFHSKVKGILGTHSAEDRRTGEDVLYCFFVF